MNTLTPAPVLLAPPVATLRSSFRTLIEPGKITPKNNLKYLQESVKFLNLWVTTNDRKNANSFQLSKFPYISSAGGWLRQLCHSWLSDAFTPVLLFSPSKDNHK
jgi:hypothetical protein